MLLLFEGFGDFFSGGINLGYIFCESQQILILFGVACVHLENVIKIQKTQKFPRPT
jgi:hypothetical protein